MHNIEASQYFDLKVNGKFPNHTPLSIKKTHVIAKLAQEGYFKTEKSVGILAPTESDDLYSYEDEDEF